MRRFGIKFIFCLFLVLYTVGCNSKSKNTDKKIQNLPVEVLTDKEDSLASQTFKYDDHCLKYNPGTGVDIAKSKIFYSSYISDGITGFNSLVESAYLFHYYLPFIEIFRYIFHYHQIQILGNPKYLFLDALENLNSGEIKKAYEQLTEFVDIEHTYNNHPKKYFKLGCYEEDLDWLYTHSEHYTYVISKHLIGILDNFSPQINNTNHDSNRGLLVDDLKQFRELLENLDDTPNQIDIFENILFIIHNLLLQQDIEKSDGMMKVMTEFSEHTWNTIDMNDDSLIINQLNVFNDSYSYLLTSQLEIALYKKLNDAHKLFQDHNILQLDNNELLMKELKPYALTHYYELLLLYDIQQTAINSDKVYLKIKSIIEDWNYDELFDWVRLITESKQSSSLFIQVENMLNQHQKGAIDSTDYFILYNQLLDKDFFLSFRLPDSDKSKSSLLYPESEKLKIIKEFISFNQEYDCEEEDICGSIYPRILGYFFDIYEYHSGIIYHKFKQEIIHLGGKPVNSINLGVLPLLYALDDIIVIYN